MSFNMGFNTIDTSALQTCCWKVFLPFLLVVLPFLPGCSPQPAQVRPAFYHWQTRLALTAAERAYLDSLGVRRLYVKFFDVDWEEGAGAVPRASLQVDTAHLQELSITPTVFIANQALERLPAAEAEILAGRIREKLFRLIAELPGNPVEEIQIDCDWTAGTRDRFFALLQALRPPLLQQGMTLSATIRLHQVRYPGQTGVPPVDRGLLMCYNVGDLEDWEDPNSILRVDAVQSYLSGFEAYPLPLDLALPAYGWGVLFREGRLVRLLNGLRPEELTDTSRFVKLGPQRFEVVKSTYLDGYYLYRGDRIRTEAAGDSTLRATASLLQPYFRSRSFTLAFYHLDTSTVNRYPYVALEEVVHMLEKRR